MKKTTPKHKLAFIGGGINSVVGSAHFAALNIDDNAELVAGFFSRNREINDKSAAYYRVSSDRVYYDLDSMIKHEKGKIDAAVILTPTDQHAEQTIKLLENNIPVICEKALVSSVEEAILLNKAIDNTNGFLAVMYNYLGYPIIRELKHMIDNSQLGKIKHLQIEMPQEGFASKDLDGSPVIPQDWRLNDNYIPTISLDLGVHIHMFVKYLTNQTPVKVVAKTESLGNFNNISDNVNCIIEYSDSISCNMWYSKFAIGCRNGLRLRVFGEKAAAEWLQEDPEIIHMADNTGQRWKIDRGTPNVSVCNNPKYNRFKVGHPAGFIEAYANYYNDIFSALSSYNQHSELTLHDCFGAEASYEGIKLFHAIQKSSQTHMWETV